MEPKKRNRINEGGSGGAHSLLINAANLHVGGSVQVASSFLVELARLKWGHDRIGVVASTEVDRQVRAEGVDLSVFSSYTVADVFGLSRGPANLRRTLEEADVVFTVFGPLYRLKKPRLSIVGFAQPWILYPDNDAYRLLSPFSRISARVKFWLQTIAFVYCSDTLVVEAEHVADRIVELGLVPREKVRVIPNTLNGLYLNPESWKPVEIESRSAGTMRIGLISRDYPHKNLGILPTVRSILRDQHGIFAEFFVTLTPKEWWARSEQFRSSVNNVGPLTADQCPRFYEQMDAVIFPSLLECFSATPLEAMYMGKPLFASDRHFVREVCGDNALYFDPNSPDDAAHVIARYVATGLDPTRIEVARDRVRSFPGARQRAAAYLDEIYRLLNES